MDRRHLRRQKIVQQLFAAMFDDSQTESPRAEKTDMILQHLQEIDAHITHYAQKYVIDKIARVDLAILRLSIYDLMIEKQVPPKVIINEAVELAKELGGDKSPGFINAVLGKVYENEYGELTEPSN